MRIGRAQRWPAHYKIQFAYAEDAGEGMTLDLSRSGVCLISTTLIEPGVQYARLVLSEAENRYIEYQTAIVRWCRKGRIGLEASSLGPDDEHRLLQLLCLLAKPDTAHVITDASASRWR
jgi:hypothetical protein